MFRCPENKTRREELLDEANFYQIRGIITQLKGNLTILSSIIKEESQASTIMSWLPPGASCTLLFRATTEGKNAAAFHRCCDKKGPTLVVEVPCSEAIPQSHGLHVSNSFTLNLLFIVYGIRDLVANTSVAVDKSLIIYSLIYHNYLLVMYLSIISFFSNFHW